MSDLSPDQTTSVASSGDKRPGVVTLLAVLVFIGALLQIFAAAAAIILAFRPGQVQQLFGQPVSDWYWFMTAALAFVLALIYIWMGRGMLAGDAQAWMLLNLIAIINIVFSVFQLAVGAGWAALILNLLILGLNNTTSARSWFRVES